jgi:hypothetical protein
MRLARDQNNALLTDAFRPQSEQSVIHFMVELHYGGSNGTLYLALYGNILRWKYLRMEIFDVMEIFTYGNIYV